MITADLAATFAGLPVYVHTIEHADGVVLVDTGMLDPTPELDEEGAPVPMPENIPRDVAGVINTTFTSTTAAVIACFPVCCEPERSSSGWKSDGNERVR